MPKRRKSGPADRITIDRAILSGAPAITGTQIGVAAILRMLGRVPSFEQLLDLLPQLTLEDVQEALTYAAAAIETQFPPRTLSEQGITMEELLEPGPAEDGIPLREYTPEQITQFLEDDKLTDEELAIVRRFGVEPPF